VFSALFHLQLFILSFAELVLFKIYVSHSGQFCVAHAKFLMLAENILERLGNISQRAQEMSGRGVINKR
jgi:hypothetical protein